MEDIGSLCLNFIADLAQSEPWKGAGGCTGAEQGQPMPPLSPAQVSLLYDEPSSCFPTLLCPCPLPIVVQFACYDFAF